jgi:hypothetical protein
MAITRRFQLFTLFLPNENMGRAYVGVRWGGFSFMI